MSFSDSLARILEDNWNTPDMIQLEMMNSHLLFVYDSLRAWGENNWRLTQEDGNVWLGEGRTARRFELFKNSWDTIMIHRPKSVDPRFVVGELWLVGTKTIRALDAEVYMNRHKFIRERDTVIMNEVTDSTYQRSGRKTFVAHMYFGEHSFWKEQIKLNYVEKIMPQRTPGLHEFEVLEVQ